MSRKQFRELAPPERAEEVLSSFTIDPGTEQVSLRSARSRILTERVDAAIDVPGFDRASMDGYAVVAEDTFGASESEPVALDLLGVVHAGEKPEVSGESGGAIEISTGAVLPEGTDAVVMVERTARKQSEIHVFDAVAPGDNVMVAGTDIAAGARALGPGTSLSPREIGLLSALGQEELEVVGKPTVGIISTGDELVRPGNDLDPRAGEIYDVNSHTLSAGVEETGGDPVVYPHVGDSYEGMHELLLHAAQECDIVLSSGSTSAGAVDIIHRVIEEEGELLLHGVAVKPGKPMLIGRIAGTPFVGLPGYPVSALTIFQYFVAPIIRRSSNRPEPPTVTITGEMAVREQYGEGRLRFMPVGVTRTATESLLVYPVDKGSGATTSLAEADGFVEIPAAVTQLERGEQVEVRLFSESVRPPRVFSVGEDDPVFSWVLDQLTNPRFLNVGTQEGLRRLRDGIPDVAVAAGPESDARADRVLGEWNREWGVIVPEGNPHNITGIESLVETEIRVVNRERGSGLRESLIEQLRSYADTNGLTLGEVTSAITGFNYGVKAHESPARHVAVGNADAGLGLRVSAQKLNLGFVKLGTESVRVVANEDRLTKPGVQDLVQVLDTVDSVLTKYPGFRAD